MTLWKSWKIVLMKMQRQREFLLLQIFCTIWQEGDTEQLASLHFKWACLNGMSGNIILMSCVLLVGVHCSVWSSWCRPPLPKYQQATSVRWHVISRPFLVNLGWSANMHLYLNPLWRVAHLSWEVSRATYCSDPLFCRDKHEAGWCSMYGICGSREDGQPLNCPKQAEAVTVKDFLNSSSL